MVINGPNLNFLGIREKDIYGTRTYDNLLEFIRNYCKKEKIEVSFRQSNHEGDLIDWIQSCYGEYDGIVINPGGYTMTSIALLDAVKAVGLPTVEVHISDMDHREPFRKISYIGLGCIRTICGMGFEGYTEAIREIIRFVSINSN